MSAGTKPVKPPARRSRSDTQPEVGLVHLSIILVDSLEEHCVLYGVIRVDAGSKLLPVSPADLLDVESFEACARDYFGAECRHVGDWPISLSTAMRQAVAA